MENRDKKILPRNTVLMIRKASRKWLDKDIKDLVTAIIDSHEELRRQRNDYKEMTEWYRASRKRRAQ